MLKHSDLFHIPYYQKAAFTGSLGGMRFYIEKAGEKDAPAGTDCGRNASS